MAEEPNTQNLKTQALYSEQFSRLTSLHGNILRARKNPGVDVFEHIRGILDNEFKYQMLPDSSGPHPARILRILKGPNTVGYGETKCLNLRGKQRLQQELMLSDAVYEEKLRSASENPIRVIAKVYDTDLDLDFQLPKPWDKLLDSLHGEFWAIGDTESFNSLAVGQLVLVSLPNKESRTASLTGNPAGLLLGPFHENVIARMQTVVELAGAKIDKECPPPEYNDAGAKKLVVSTFSSANLPSPSFKFIKSTNKTGIYGDGTAQTKSHFVNILKNHPLPSAVGKIGGPSPDGENAFVWVGHLKNNGYLDLLDRPISPGRETIIYASKMLDASQPVEIKYYLHDIGGFGNSWSSGPNTPVGVDISTNNDFKNKIAPSIKDLIKNKRNVILVIPEMFYSLGFGTRNGDAARVSDMALGISRTTPSKASTTTNPSIRTKINFTVPSMRAEVTNYLNSIPSKTNENLSQITRLQQRELSTFDGSVTGGNFAAMHEEVLQVIQNYLGITYEGVEYVSVIADGLAAVTLAGLSKISLQRRTQNEARKSFLSMPIDRFDFISRGIDKSKFFHFQHFPPIEFFQNDLQRRIQNNPSRRVEFNYIATEEEFKSSECAGREFFTHGSEVNTQFNMAVSPNEINAAAVAPSVQAGELKFTKTINNLTVNLHITGPNIDADEAVGYAMVYKTGEEPMRRKESYNSVTTSDMPDHAGAISSQTGLSSATILLRERDEMLPKIEYFSNALFQMVGDVSNVCKIDEYKRYCKRDLLYFGKDGEFMRDMSEWWTNVKRLLIIERVVNYEIYLQDQIRTQQQAAQEANLKDTELALAENEADSVYDGSGVLVGQSGLSYKDTFRALKSYFVSTKFQDLAEVTKIYGEPLVFPGQSDAAITTPLVKKIAELDSLKIEAQKAKQKLEQLKRIGAPERVGDCEQIPVRMAESPYQAPGIDAVSTAPTTICRDKKFKSAFRTAAEIIQHIPFAPKKTDYTFHTVSSVILEGTDQQITTNISSEDSKLEEKIPSYSQYKFEADKFFHQVRARNGAVKRKKSDVSVWSCLAPRIEMAWRKACAASNYYPFHVASGIVGSYKGKPGGKDGIVAYDTGMSPAAYGLALNIDAFLCGNPNNPGHGSMSVWTGAWSPGLGGHPAFAKELYDLGVFNNHYESFRENCWRDGDYNSRVQLVTNDIEKAALHDSDLHTAEVEKVLVEATDTPIVPLSGYPLSNPTRWIIAFCEASGMKWGNSFFMKRRFKSGRWRNAITGQYKWSLREKARLDRLYGIKNVVDKIIAISWPGVTTKVDNHSYFQFWNPLPTDPVNSIPWDQLEDEALQLEVKMMNVDPRGDYNPQGVA